MSGREHTLSRRVLRKAIHTLSYHCILKQPWTRTSYASGFCLKVPPTVFHPGVFVTSEFFASFIDTLDLSHKQVAEVGTGSGILALAAARAGAANVLAIDVNPRAAAAAEKNARSNGLMGITGLCCDLLSAVSPKPQFDVIFSSPPSFSGEPRDLTDRAWHAGKNFRNIQGLFKQSRDRLLPGGDLYVLLSSDSDVPLLTRLGRDSGFRTHVVAEKSIGIETFLIYRYSLG